MSRVVGIDLTEHAVRAVLLRSAFRKLELEALSEELITDASNRAGALRACVERLGGLDAHHVDTVVTLLEGGRTFVHKLSLPPSAEKRLEELLPFELEAQLPLEIDDVVYGFQVLPRRRGSSEPLEVLTLSARTEQVERRIAEFRESFGREPERVGSSALDLGQLVTVSKALEGPGPVVIVDLGLDTTDVCLLMAGVVQGARSLSGGVSTFPDGAGALLAQLRQTLTAFAVNVESPRVVLSGEGAQLDGIVPYLKEHLGAQVEVLAVEIETPNQVPDPRLPRFGRALASALHGVRGKGFDLRQGELAFQRGYGFLKDKAPLLVGMGLAVLISFLFSTWAESRALDREEEMLSSSLEQITKATFNQATSDPDEALALLERARSARPEDPMPYMDGFGAAVALAEVLPDDIKHDVEQFDYTKGKLKLRALVSSTDEAQRVAKALDEHRCIENATITKISQVVNSERERYMLEADVRCPEDPAVKKKTEGAP